MVGDVPGLKVLRWRRGTQFQERQGGLRIPGVAGSTGGAKVLRSSQGWEPGSRLRAPGLGAHINCQPPQGRGTAFLDRAAQGGDPPPEEQSGPMPLATLKFGTLKFGHSPEIKRLPPRQGECRVQMKTREANRVIDCFPVRAHRRVEDTNFQVQSWRPVSGHFYPASQCSNPSGSKTAPPSRDRKSVV